MELILLVEQGKRYLYYTPDVTTFSLSFVVGVVLCLKRRGLEVLSRKNDHGLKSIRRPSIYHVSKFTRILICNDCTSYALRNCSGR